METEINCKHSNKKYIMKTNKKQKIFMRVRFAFLVATTLVIGFTSCQKSDETEKVASKYITVDAGMGSLTRATPTAFEDGDKISVYAWAGTDFATATNEPLVVNNSVNTLSEVIWSAEPLMLWKDMVTAHYFVAIYPVQTVTAFEAYEFTLTDNQASNDLLFATNTTGLTGNEKTDVPLVFDHSQSKLIVNLTFRTEFGATPPTVESVTVLAKSVAIIDFLTKTTTVKEGEALELTIPEATSNTAYESVVVPQTINKITIAIAGKNYIYNNTDGIALAQGKKNTINLIVGRDKIELVGDITINGWGDGETITGGDAEQE